MEEQETPYVVARGADLEGVVERVNKLAAIGYRPIGSLVVTSNGFHRQAMWKDPRDIGIDSMAKKAA